MEIECLFDVVSSVFELRVQLLPFNMINLHVHKILLGEKPSVPLGIYALISLMYKIAEFRHLKVYQYIFKIQFFYSNLASNV